MEKVNSIFLSNVVLVCASPETNDAEFLLLILLRANTQAMEKEAAADTTQVLLSSRNLSSQNLVPNN